MKVKVVYQKRFTKTMEVDEKYSKVFTSHPFNYDIDIKLSDELYFHIEDILKASEENSDVIGIQDCTTENWLDIG